MIDLNSNHKDQKEYLEKILKEMLDSIKTDIAQANALNEKANTFNRILQVNDEEQYFPRQCLRALDFLKDSRPIPIRARAKDGIDDIAGYQFDADMIRLALDKISTYTSEGILLPAGVKDMFASTLQPLTSKSFNTIDDYSGALEKVRSGFEDSIAKIKAKVKEDIEERLRLCQKRDEILRELGIFKFKITAILEKVNQVSPPEKFEPWLETKQ